MGGRVYVSPEIAAVRALYAPPLGAAARTQPIRQHLAGQAARLLAVRREGDPARRSSYGRRASLLHYMTANGVESWREVASIYVGARPVGLVVSSAHAQAAGKADAMAAALGAAGAY